MKEVITWRHTHAVAILAHWLFLRNFWSHDSKLFKVAILVHFFAILVHFFDFSPLFGDFGLLSRFWSTFSPFWSTWIYLHMITSFKLFFVPKNRPLSTLCRQNFTTYTSYTVLLTCLNYWRKWLNYIVRIHVYSRLFTIFGSAVFRQSEWWFVPR